MQLFSVDTTVFLKRFKKYLIMKTWKKRTQKLFIIDPIFFLSTALSQILKIYIGNWTEALSVISTLCSTVLQRYTYRVLQTIQIKLILLCVWAEPAILGKGPFLYYVRVFWGFFEPPTHLRKDVFTT